MNSETKSGFLSAVCHVAEKILSSKKRNDHFFFFSSSIYCTRRLCTLCLVPSDKFSRKSNRGKNFYSIFDRLPIDFGREIKTRKFHRSSKRVIRISGKKKKFGDKYRPFRVNLKNDGNIQEYYFKKKKEYRSVIAKFEVFERFAFFFAYFSLLNAQIFLCDNVTFCRN